MDDQEKPLDQTALATAHWALGEAHNAARMAIWAIVIAVSSCVTAVCALWSAYF